MRTMIVALSASWLAIARLQAIVAKSRRVSPSAAESLDEALSTVLEAYSKREVRGKRQIDRRFRSLARNRAQKYRARRRLVFEKAHLFAAKPTPDPSEVVAQRELVGFMRREVDDDEWAIFTELAHAWPLQKIGQSRGLTLGALKSRVFRARERIRHSAAGQRVAQALCA